MTESEWVTGIHPGYRTKVIKAGNATIEINRPILTDEERAKREKAIINSLRAYAQGRSNSNGL